MTTSQVLTTKIVTVSFDSSEAVDNKFIYPHGFATLLTYSIEGQSPDTQGVDGEGNPGGGFTRGRDADNVFALFPYPPGGTLTFQITLTGLEAI